MHVVDDRCFAITIRARATGRDAIIKDWLRGDAKAVLETAAAAGDWRTSSLVGPTEMLVETCEYAVTMYYVRWGLAQTSMTME